MNAFVILSANYIYFFPGRLLMACALCLLPPNCQANAKKLKKLFGNNAEVERGVLYAILIRAGINIQFQDAALLCIFCQRLLLKVRRLEYDLNTAILSVSDKLKQLYSACKLIHHSS